MNTDDASDRRFVHSRLIDATPEQVFSAFSQPERLARWWGPDGFSSTFEAFDLRPGGSWRFVMHGPDGTNYPNVNVFKTVEPPNRVEVEHISENHHFVLSITFAGHGSQTLVRWRKRSIRWSTSNSSLRGSSQPTSRTLIACNARSRAPTSQVLPNPSFDPTRETLATLSEPDADTPSCGFALRRLHWSVCFHRIL